MNTATLAARRAQRKAEQEHPDYLGLLVREAWAICGGIGEPSKMPGYSYGLPAPACKTGQRLAKIPGTGCSKCYADKNRGHYRGTVLECQYRRLASLEDPRWVEAMCTLIKRKARIRSRAKRQRDGHYFRWHDAGDVQSLQHLLLIFAVCWICPEVEFWLPTQERQYLGWAIKFGFDWPPNLNVRLSDPFMDIAEPLKAWGLTTSGIRTGETVAADVHQCPAPDQGNECGECRACWDRSVKKVSYHLHR